MFPHTFSFFFLNPSLIWRTGSQSSVDAIEWLINSTARLLGLLGLQARTAKTDRTDRNARTARIGKMDRICFSKYLKVPRKTSKYPEVHQSTQKYLKVPRIISNLIISNQKQFEGSGGELKWAMSPMAQKPRVNPENSTFICMNI